MATTRTIRSIKMMGFFFVVVALGVYMVSIARTVGAL